jgi:hypothetical protein
MRIILEDIEDLILLEQKRRKAWPEPVAPTACEPSVVP